ncbi:TonB-dependent receptor [Sphingomonas pruni]|uniref:TonB-dependent receptor n=1 Tax=Sphingomonas pruni TaxID=40683 RepID=UPI00082F51C3|nr:TonB-dependent receptor [Sphingomonas pruni]
MTFDIRFALMASAACLVAVAPAAARSQASYHFDVAAQPLGSALQQVSRTAGVSILFKPDDVAGFAAPALHGTFTLAEALDRLLAGTPLAASYQDGTVVVRGRGAAADAAAAPLSAPEAAAPDILVTGSRIRGAKVASPVVTVSREDARNQGQGSMGEIARSLPQSFGGGQNPGLGFNVPTASGVDVGGGSSFNLRGLGSDATLTLLDGHRLAYGGSRQSIDVSVIPLGALDRVEVVADGASALYGSDAVGGVANIILRRDLDGVESRARLGAATDGGDFQQQYGLTAGTHWASGGILAAYEFNRATAVDAEDRDYAAVRSRGLRLLPATRSNSIVVAAHQELGSRLELAVDGVYNARRTRFVYPIDPSGDLSIARDVSRTRETSFVIAPTLTWRLGNGGRIGLTGSYGTDRVHYADDDIEPPAPTFTSGGCYCNRMTAIELGGDTPLFKLPGGDAKLALGIGYRRTGLTTSRFPSDPQDFTASQVDSYGFAELELPFVSPDKGVPGLASLTLDAAVRYERYKGLASVATPKLGLIWSPLKGLELKASWGKSFRAPTLQQRYQTLLVFLFPATTLGGAGYPSDATALYVQGGNPDLKPERATSWSLGAAIKPAAIPGLSIELNYFSTRYIDRIVAPIGFITQSLSSPLYAPQVTIAPSPSLVDATRAAAGIFTLAGVRSYDPSKVVAIVDNSSVNAGRQPAHGIDAIVRYRATLGARDTLTFEANTSYLVSSRQISPTQPVIPLAGILFNPPHWRGRGSLSWDHARVGATATLNYVGNLSDTRRTPALKVPGQATVDLALRFRTGDRAPGALRGLDLILAAQNLLDTPPPLITTGPVTDTPYDSTNYSPVGRFVSFTIAKKW